MRNILVICDTYYQLIVAIQLKATLFKDERVSCILTDYCVGADRVVKRLKKECFFEKTFFYRKHERKNTIVSKLQSISGAITGKAHYLDFLMDLAPVDEVIFWIPDKNIFSYLYRKNSDIVCSKFEEGIGSYLNDFMEVSYKTDVARRIFSKKALMDSIENFYCFWPNYYSGKLKSIRIPTMDATSSALAILKRVFEIDEAKRAYDQKYIYFASRYDYMGGEQIGEGKIVKKLAEIVGKDNLLVKAHPSDRRTFYKDNGLRVDQNLSVPWEAIHFCIDLSDKVLITSTSMAVISTSLMLQTPPKTVFMYEYCNTTKNLPAADNIDTLRRVLHLLKTDGNRNNIVIAKTDRKMNSYLS